MTRKTWPGTLGGAMRKIRKELGFTLVELMIVIAIMAILTSIAFTSYKSFYMRARASEAIKYLGVIRTLQISYRAINSTYLILPSHPPGVVPTTYQAWGIPGGNWDELGFVPEGTVRYQYTGAPGSTGNISNSFELTAQTDFDADGAVFDTWTLTNQGRRTTHTNHYK